MISLMKRHKGQIKKNLENDVLKSENSDLINKIINNDCFNGLDKIVSNKIADNSINVVLIAPPYSLDRLDNNWDYQEVKEPQNH